MKIIVESGDLIKLVVKRGDLIKITVKRGGMIRMIEEKVMEKMDCIMFVP